MTDEKRRDEVASDAPLPYSREEKFRFEVEDARKIIAKHSETLTTGWDTFSVGFVEELLNRLAAQDAEIAALKARLTPGQSDRECADKILIETFSRQSADSDNLRFEPIDKRIAEIIAAHVASAVAPLQAKLDEAVGREDELRNSLKRISDAWVEFVNSDRGLIYEGPLSIAIGGARQLLATTSGEGMKANTTNPAHGG